MTNDVTELLQSIIASLLSNRSEAGAYSKSPTDFLVSKGVADVDLRGVDVGVVVVQTAESLDLPETAMVGIRQLEGRAGRAGDPGSPPDTATPDGDPGGAAVTPVVPCPPATPPPTQTPLEVVEHHLSYATCQVYADDDEILHDLEQHGPYPTEADGLDEYGDVAGEMDLAEPEPEAMPPTGAPMDDAETGNGTPPPPDDGDAAPGYEQPEYPDDELTPEYPDGATTPGYPDDEPTPEYPDDPATATRPPEAERVPEYPNGEPTPEYPDGEPTPGYPDGRETGTPVDPGAAPTPDDPRPSEPSPGYGTGAADEPAPPAVIAVEEVAVGDPGERPGRAGYDDTTGNGANGHGQEVIVEPVYESPDPGYDPGYDPATGDDPETGYDRTPDEDPMDDGMDEMMDDVPGSPTDPDPMD